MAASIRFASARTTNKVIGHGTIARAIVSKARFAEKQRAKQSRTMGVERT